MNTVVQEHMPAWYFARYRGPLEDHLVSQAVAWSSRAQRLTRRPAAREFQGRGFKIVYQNLSFGGARVRAKLNLRSKELFIDPNTETELFQQLDQYGFELEPSPKDLILYHELFHLLCPRCPSRVAELAAHLYCAESLGLNYFPGLLDLTLFQGLRAS